MSKEILVYSEDKDVTLELLSKALEIRKDIDALVSSIVLSKDYAVNLDELHQHGAERIYILDIRTHITNEIVSDLLVKLVKERNPMLFLIGATKDGREIASVISAKLGIRYIPDCIGIELEDSNIKIERSVYAGNLINVYITHGPLIASIPPKVFEAKHAEVPAKKEIITVKYEVSEPKVNVIEYKQKEVTGLNIENAEVIISVGRGLAKKEDISMIKELAELIGAQVACSRPLATDLKWFPEDQYVGLSGKKVSPKLYIALGISGQVQHLVGIKGAKFVVAVNKDENAPIFKSSDLGLIGDMYEIIPKLIEVIKSKR